MALQHIRDKWLTCHPGVVTYNAYEVILYQVSYGTSQRVSSQASQECMEQEGLHSFQQVQCSSPIYFHYHSLKCNKNTK